MLAKDIMTTEVFTVKPDKSLNDIEISAEIKHIRHIPIVDENEAVVGIISIRDILAHLSDAAASRFVPVEDIMIKEVVTASPEATVKAIATLMTENTISCVPIIESEKLVGIVSEADFLKLA